MFTNVYRLVVMILKRLQHPLVQNRRKKGIKRLIWCVLKQGGRGGRRKIKRDVMRT